MNKYLFVFQRMALNPKLIMLIQFVVGLVVLFIINFFSLLAMRADKLFIDEKYDYTMKRKTVVVDGILSPTIPQAFNTTSIFAKQFMPINPSVNVKGGAQFTYMFWLKILDPSRIANKVLFMKGDPTLYTYKKNVYNPGDPNTIASTSQITDLAVFCPMFKFGFDPDEYLIQFNTFNNMNEQLYIKKINAANNVMRQNLISIIGANNWVMMTVVFEDNIPINDFENGLSVKFYVNDLLYQSATYQTAMKQNKGDLVLFPAIGNDPPITGCQISNFLYYNYAVGDNEIIIQYTRGPNMSAASISGSTIYNPVSISDYNMLDIYNSGNMTSGLA